MRTLRVFESISTDGYFADSRGDMSWAHTSDPEFLQWVGGNASSGSELLFGRKTYEMMESFWTGEGLRQIPEVAKGMNAARKYVASRTIKPTWNNSVLLEGNLVEAVRALRASPGPNLAILGSGEIAAQLGEAGLVDEYQLVVVPIALGGGRTVFSKGQKLRLIDHRAFRCGNVAVTYATA